MRTLAFALIAAAAAQPPAPTPPPAPATPQDYVCAFSGECSDDQNQAEPGDLAGHPGISATRGFALSRPTPEANARPRPRGTPRVAGQALHRAPAAAAGQRVNLRLAFDTGSARLTPDAMAQAGVFARALMLPQLVTMHFRIEGHTDSVGSRAMNMDLSQRRAQAVADFLVGMGVGRDRLDVRGYGFDQPLPGTRASDGENRRVEAVRTS